VIVWFPAARVDVENVAVPELKLKVASVAAPSINETVPDAAPPSDVDTDAVNVIVWPKTDGLKEDVTVVELVS
jgi:hypothetical protein